MREAAEKRRHPRISVHFPLRFRDPLARPSQVRSVQAKDLSLGGLRFQSEDFLPLDSTLFLELRLQNSSRPIRSIARVAWARSLPSGYRYEVGSEFVDLVASERKALEDYLTLFSEGHG